MSIKTVVFGSNVSTVDPRADVIKEFEIKPEQLAPYDILVWYYSYEDYSGDAYLLLREKAEPKRLYVVEGGHCSCHGLEGQFEPSRTYARIEQKRFENAYRAPFSAGDETSRVAEETKLGIKRFQTLIARLAAKETDPNA